jgi:hypothetical protein
MAQATAPAEIEPPENPICDVCRVAMRLCGIEPHPTLNRTDLWTYVCPHCEEVQTAAVSSVPAWLG